MDYTLFKLYNDTELYVLQSDLLKTTSVGVSFYTRMDHTEALKTAVAKVLMKGSKNFPSQQHISLASDKEMGATIYPGVGSIGDLHKIGFGINVLTDERLIGGRKTLENTLALLWDVVFNPLTADTEQSKLNVENVKEHLVRKKKEAQMKPDAKAKRGFLKLAIGDNSFTYSEIGSLEEIENIDPASVYEMYGRLITNSPRKMFVVTHLDPEYIRKMIGSIGLNAFSSGSKILLSDPPQKLGAVFYDTSDFDQTRVFVGYSLDTPVEFRLRGALSVLNTYLGGFASSRLFDEIRTKRSLAYGAGSNFSLDLGLVYGATGVDAENVDLVVDLIKKEFKKIAKGDIDWNLMWQAKKYLLNGRRSDAHIVSSDLGLLEKLSLKGLLDEVSLYDNYAKDVCKQDILDAASLIYIGNPIVYCLMQKEEE